MLQVTFHALSNRQHVIAACPLDSQQIDRVERGENQSVAQGELDEIPIEHRRGQHRDTQFE